MSTLSESDYRYLLRIPNCYFHTFVSYTRNAFMYNNKMNSPKAIREMAEDTGYVLQKMDKLGLLNEYLVNMYNRIVEMKNLLDRIVREDGGHCKFEDYMHLRTMAIEGLAESAKMGE